MDNNRQKEQTEDKVIINLEKSIHANGVEPKYIIQQEAYKRFSKLLSEKLIFANKYNPNENFDRYHETLTIQGERGTGKTSFILSMKKYIDNIKSDDPFNDIQTLDILDPTLLSSRQYILVNIISHIRDVVSNSTKNVDEHKLRDWNNSLLNLAEGLPLTTTVGNNPNTDSLWDDAGLALEKGLKKAKAGIEFEKEFHKFIHESLKLIDKKAFLLIMDDIDTNFDKGWEVLETLRKYITSPQIISIVSGDIHLYTKLIRKHQWELFEKLSTYEKEKIDTYISAIDTLEEQYLIKILKPENFINLHRLSYFLYYQKNQITIIEQEGTEEHYLDNFFAELMKQGFNISGSSQIENYIRIFASMPIRTNIQLFKAYFESNKSNFDQISFLQKIKNIFITTFIKYDIDMQFFELLRDQNNINMFLSKMTKNSAINFSEVCDLTPKDEEESINVFTAIIASIFDGYSTGRHDKHIEWLLKVVLINELVYKLGLIKKDDNNVLEYLQSNKYLSSEERVLRISGLLFEEKYMYAKPYKHHKYLLGNEKTLNSIISSSPVKDEKTFLLQILFSEAQKTISEIHERASFLYLLSFIEELYKCKEYTTEEFSQTLKKRYSDLELVSRMVAIPKLEKVDEDEDEVEETSEEEQNFEEYTFSEEFVNVLHNWVIQHNDIKTSKISLYNVTKAFSRFTTRHVKIKYGSSENLQEYIELSIYTFLNELLIQSAHSRLQGTVETFQEIRSSKAAHTNFMKNVAKFKNIVADNIDEVMNDFSDLFVSLIRCPLLSYYLSEYDKICSELGFNEVITDSDVSTNMQQIILHGKKLTKEQFKLFVENKLNISDFNDKDRIEKAIANENVAKKTFKPRLPAKLTRTKYCNDLAMGS